MELKIVRDLTKHVGQRLQKEVPGPVVYEGLGGDFKRRIDRLANKLLEYPKVFKKPTPWSVGR